MLDLIAAALARSPQLTEFAGRVSDSGEGRWTLKAAIDESVPAPILSTAIGERFASRGEAEFANRLRDRAPARRCSPPGATARLPEWPP